MTKDPEMTDAGALFAPTDVGAVEAVEDGDVELSWVMVASPVRLVEGMEEEGKVGFDWVGVTLDWVADDEDDEDEIISVELADDGTATSVPHGPIPYAPSAAAPAQLESSAEGNMNPASTSLSTFHDESDVTRSLVPSVYVTLATAITPAGPVPLVVLTAGRLVALTANRADVPESPTTKREADFQVSRPAGDEAAMSPLT